MPFTAFGDFAYCVNQDQTNGQVQSAHPATLSNTLLDLLTKKRCEIPIFGSDKQAEKYFVYLLFWV